MKLTTKYCLVLVMVLVLAGNYNLFGQWKYGLHGGMGGSTQSELGLLWDNSEFCFSDYIGLSAEFPFSDRISYQIELNFQEKGEDHFDYSEPGKPRVHREFKYFSVPLLAKITPLDRLGEDQQWGVQSFAGPYLAVLLSANSASTVNDITTTSNIISESEKSDLGLLFGISVFHELESDKLISFGLRYGMGLKAVDKADADLRNKQLGIDIAYRF